ncbi:MAG: choice-of-anchor D domain-containing protein [Acidobacteriales bacterium]|nr:choice-of-anchor D domain-containing protein [Terriglobales bacterium]
MIPPKTKAGTKSAPQSVTVTNVGAVALNITRVALGGEWPNQYSQTNTCPTQLAPGDSCTLSVTFERLSRMPKAHGQRTSASRTMAAAARRR